MKICSPSHFDFSELRKIRQLSQSDSEIFKEGAVSQSDSSPGSLCSAEMSPSNKAYFHKFCRAREASILELGVSKTVSKTAFLE